MEPEGVSTSLSVESGKPQFGIMFKSWQETVESSYFHSFLVSKAIIVINKTSEIFKRIPPSHKSLFSRQHLHAPPPRLLPRRGGLSAKREFTESLGRMKQSNVSCLSHVRQVSVYFTWIRRLTVATFL